jgi:antitoxin (DNA-binding transcriptional repressor) of toxin-antitoxin stability system
VRFVWRDGADQVGVRAIKAVADDIRWQVHVFDRSGHNTPNQTAQLLREVAHGRTAHGKKIVDIITHSSVSLFDSGRWLLVSGRHWLTTDARGKAAGHPTCR